jgi:acrylyl-CoA reductase (NADPH)
VESHEWFEYGKVNRMSGETFRALIAEGNSNEYSVALKELKKTDLPSGEVLVEVSHSSLNYKDGLAVVARGKIIRKFPMICGIDLAGRVLESSSAEFRVGDEVLAVGQGLGETQWGGYSQLARLPADTLLHLPKGLTLKQAMAIGTAGFTAMLSLMALENYGVKPGAREVLVTGAGGGVGSISVLLLAARDFEVAASTGRPELHPFLHSLGAATIVDRAELFKKSPPLGSERWAGAIDSVGGQTLATVITGISSYGAVAACGLAGGAELETTVFPFILRNIALLGINSVGTPKARRIEAWDRLSRELPLDKLDSLAAVEPLTKIKELAEKILAGQIRGRVIIDVNR